MRQKLCKEELSDPNTALAWCDAARWCPGVYPGNPDSRTESGGWRRPRVLSDEGSPLLAATANYQYSKQLNSAHFYLHVP